MRRVPRIPVKLDAVLISEGVTLKETITNIGPQGAFVTVPSHAGVGYLVDLRFRPPSSPQPLNFWRKSLARPRMELAWNSWTSTPRTVANYGRLLSRYCPKI